MSEFVDYESEFRPLPEVVQDLSDRAADFIANLGDRLGVVYNAQGQSVGSNGSEQQPPAPAHGAGSNCAMPVCSACGRGGDQRPKPGDRQPMYK